MKKQTGFIQIEPTLKLWVETYGNSTEDAVLFISGALGESHVKAQTNLTDRTEQLKKVNIPALVILGEEDYLVDKYGGIQTVECLPNSKLVLIPTMGHVLFKRVLQEKFENEIVSFLLKNQNN